MIKRKGNNMKYIIQSLVKGSDSSWFDFDTADDKDKAELRLSWIKHYYKDDTFRLTKETDNGI
tara:strand:- start:895 stop:1083 length:189 start_codon:yes stop_codon:yes gene_type:complete